MTVRRTWAGLLTVLVACGGVEEEDLQVYTEAASVRVCPQGETVHGIDVSHHQQRIDWDQVAADGVEFAFIRVSDGLFEDREFERNWAEARRVGVIRGVYQYFRSSRDVAAQVDLLLRKIGPLLPGDLPPVIDIETVDGASDAEVRAAVEEWLALLTDATGRTPIVYTYPYFIFDHVRLPDLGGYPLWIAHYGPRCPETPPPWDDWLFHQTSSSGSVAGIGGRVDTDVFNGPLDALQGFADFTDECGDGVCTGQETPATCPGDCPVCEPIPAEGRVVDESEICFAPLGPPEYWRSVDGAGWDDHLYWTHTTASAMAANYAVWNVEMAASGTFRIEAYTDAAWAESAQAAYDVDVNGDVERYVIDQRAMDGWSAIATVYLEAGDSVEIRLDDNTGEPNADDVQLVADALRFVPTENPEDRPLDAGVEPPGPVEDARVGPPILPVPPGPDATLGGSRGDDVVGDDGCDGCATEGGSGPTPWLVAVVLALVALRRRRGSGET